MMNNKLIKRKENVKTWLCRVSVLITLMVLAIFVKVQMVETKMFLDWAGTKRLEDIFSLNSYNFFEPSRALQSSPWTFVITLVVLPFMAVGVYKICRWVDKHFSK